MDASARDGRISLEALRAAGEAAVALPAERLPEVLGELERLKAQAWIRMTEPAAALGPGAEEDRLLGVTEAAAMLQSTPASLYKRADGYPFTVRDGRRLRFSLRGIRAWIANSQAG
jgi:hypothetical protein